MRVAAQVVLTGDQALRLEAYARGRRTAARLVLRAQIVLLASQGRQDLEIAAALGIVPRTAARWRARFLKSGIAGLEKDAPRPGKATVLTPQTMRRIVAMTTQQKPANATHWSTRSMAAASGVSEASVRRIWKAHGLRPHRLDSFKLSNDPVLWPTFGMPATSSTSFTGWSAWCHFWSPPRPTCRRTNCTRRNGNSSRIFVRNSGKDGGARSLQPSPGNTMCLSGWSRSFVRPAFEWLSCAHRVHP